MRKTLNFNERLACTILTHLKHDGQEFLDCKFNDALCGFVWTVLRVDAVDLIKKVVALSDNTVNTTK